MAKLCGKTENHKGMLEDRQLIYRLGHGDKDALRRIYEKYKDSMYTIAYSLLNESGAAEDVLHDVFVVFTAGAGNFKLYGSLKNYLITCVLNRSRDKLRKKSEGSIDFERTAQKAGEGSDPEQEAVQTEQEDLLAQALAKVPFVQREVLILHLHGDLKFREIAGIQQVSVNTVQGRYRYGLEKLRSILDGQITL